MSVFSDRAKEIHKKMSNHLKSVRKDQDVTMRALAERLGTPHSFVGKIELQERRLDVAELVLYAEGLAQDPVALFADMLAASRR